jgi:hypothetical protein
MDYICNIVKLARRLIGKVDVLDIADDSFGKEKHTFSKYYIP